MKRAAALIALTLLAALVWTLGRGNIGQAITRHWSYTKSVQVDRSTGRPGGRTCSTSRAYRHAGLAVNYQFRRDRFPPPDTPQLDENDATREPGAVLAFDVAIRAWIAGLSKT